MSFLEKYVGPIKDKYTFFLLLAIAFLNDAVFSFYLQFLTQEVLKEGHTEDFISFLSTLDALSIILVSAGVAYLIVRFSTKFIMILGLLLAGVTAFFLSFFVSTLYLFPVLYFIFMVSLGVVGTFIITTLDTTADPKYIARVETFYYAFTGIALALGPLFISLGLHHIVDASVLTALLLIGGSVLFMNRRKLDSVHVMSTETSAPKAKGAPTKKGRSALYLTFGVPTAVLAGLVYGMCDQSTFYLVPVFGKSIGLGAEESSLIITAYSLGTVILMPFLASTIDRHSKRLMLAFYGIASMLVFGLALFVHAYVVLLILFFLGGAIYPAFDPIAHSLYGESYTGADLAKAISLQGMMYGVGSVIGPYIVTILTPKFGPDAFIWNYVVWGGFLFIVGVMAHRHYVRKQRVVNQKAPSPLS